MARFIALMEIAYEGVWPLDEDGCNADTSQPLPSYATREEALAVAQRTVGASTASDVFAEVWEIET